MRQNIDKDSRYNHYDGFHLYRSVEYRAMDPLIDIKRGTPTRENCKCVYRGVILTDMTS